MNLYENDLIESVSNELSEAPLSADVPMENVKSKRQDITHADTHLNRTSIGPTAEVYTYFADYPEPNDSTDSTVTIDQATFVSSNEYKPGDIRDSGFDSLAGTTPRYPSDSLNTELFPPYAETAADNPNAFVQPFKSTSSSTNDSENTDDAAPNGTDAHDGSEAQYTRFGGFASPDGGFYDNAPFNPPIATTPSSTAILDIDKTIFDSTFLPPKDQKNDSNDFYAPTGRYVPLPIPYDYYFLREHRNVKRHKSDPITYLPPTKTTPAPQITNQKLNSNGISVDLQRDGQDIHQLDIRFGADNKDIPRTFTPQQQRLDNNDSSSLRKFSQQIASTKNHAQAYYYTSFENNRPRANHVIQPPPLQSYYPASIQNNYASHSARPLTYRSTPIPASLPSIVYSPTAVRTLPNYVQQSVKIPIPPSLAAASNAQYYSAPAVTSPYTSRPCDLPPNRPNEKVVVKIVPANGWYLNDEKERKSYYDAVAHGLLNEDGFVYVNDVQRYSSEPTQNVPIVWYSSSATPLLPPQSPTYPSPPAYHSSQKWELPQYGGPVPVLQEQHPQQPESRQSSSSLSSSSSFVSDENRSETEDSAYNGASSYNVEQQSVGKLAGDNKNQTYSLASLRSSRGASTSSSTDSNLNERNVG